MPAITKRSLASVPMPLVGIVSGATAAFAARSLGSIIRVVDDCARGPGAVRAPALAIGLRKRGDP
jgi:hypothetical protein